MLLNSGKAFLRTMATTNICKSHKNKSKLQSFAYKPATFFTARNMTAAAKMEYKFETLSVTEAKPFVYHVAFNRPDRLNAFNRTMWL